MPTNIFTADTSSVETSIAGWFTGTQGSAVARDSTHAYDGSWAVKFTRSATVPGNNLGAPGNSAGPVTASTKYWFREHLWTATVGVNYKVNVDWYQSNNTTFISTTTMPTKVLEDNMWAQYGVYEFTTPALAAFGRFFHTEVTNVLGTGGTIWVDNMLCWRPGTGTPELGQGGLNVSNAAINRASRW